MRVTKSQFVKVFTKGMQESYPSLTEDYVREQLDALLAGNKPTEVIGMFIEGELKKVTIAED